jgi:hypothetical protein
MVLQGLTNYKLFKLGGISAGAFLVSALQVDCRRSSLQQLRALSLPSSVLVSLTHRVARRCNESLAHTAKVGRSLPYNRA